MKTQSFIAPFNDLRIKKYAYIFCFFFMLYSCKKDTITDVSVQSSQISSDDIETFTSNDTTRISIRPGPQTGHDTYVNRFY